MNIQIYLVLVINTNILIYIISSAFKQFEIYRFIEYRYCRIISALFYNHGLEIKFI